MISAWRKLDGTYWPVLIAMVSIAFVVLFLFLFPLVSAAIGFVLPFAGLGVLAAILVRMNLRWNLWHGSRPLFFSIADIGFLLCFAAFALYSFAYISDSWTNLPYVVIGFVIVAVFRVAFLEFEAWWLGILLCGVLGLVFGAYVVFTLSEPKWFFDFSSSLLLLVGMLVLFTGSTLCLLEGSGGSRRETWPGWLRTGGLVVALILMGAVAVSAGLTLANREVVTASEATGARQVTFEGGRVTEILRTWPSGEVQLLVSNEDLRVHTFTVEELGIDVMIGPKSERLIHLELSPGFYGFECRVPGHSERASFEVQ